MDTYIGLHLQHPLFLRQFKDFEILRTRLKTGNYWNNRNNVAIVIKCFALLRFKSDTVAKIWYVL